jgi:hypothetical protein
VQGTTTPPPSRLLTTNSRRVARPARNTREQHASAPALATHKVPRQSIRAWGPASSTTSSASPRTARVPAPGLADDELDEIELQLRLQATQPIIQAAAVGPRGTADLAPDVRQLRTPRRRGVLQPVSRRERLGARPLAILAVAAMVACTVAVVQPGASSHRAPSPRLHRIFHATAGAIATVTPGQLTTAAHLRALVAINAERTTSLRAAAKERRARARNARRRDARRTKARVAARAAAATHAAHATITSTSTSPASEPQPTADGGSASASPSSASSRPATSATPPGPTGGIGSMTGGCTPQC